MMCHQGCTFENEMAVWRLLMVVRFKQLTMHNMLPEALNKLSLIFHDDIGAIQRVITGSLLQGGMRTGQAKDG